MVYINSTKLGDVVINIDGHDIIMTKKQAKEVYEALFDKLKYLDEYKDHYPSK